METTKRKTKTKAQAAGRGLLAALMSLALAAALLPAAASGQAAYAAEDGIATAALTLDSGTAFGVDWVVDTSYTLTISPASEEDAEANGYEPGEMDYVAINKVPWYGYQSLIKKVVVESGVTSVCCLTSLTACSDFELPDTVTTIGQHAFQSCSKITSLDFLPDSVTTIEDYAFAYCTGITSLDGLPGSVASIGSCVFRYCKSLSYVKYPDALAATVTEIADMEFCQLAEGAVIDLSNMVNLESVGTNIANSSVSPTIILPEGLESFPVACVTNGSDVRLVIPSTVTSFTDSRKLGGSNVNSNVSSITLRFGGLIEASEDAEGLLAAMGEAVAVDEYRDFGGVSSLANLDQCYAKTTVTMDFAGESDERPTVYYLASASSEVVQLDEGLLEYDEDVGVWRLSVAGTSTGYATGLYASGTLLTSLEDASVELAGDSFVYTGEAVEPGVTVTLGGEELAEGEDYEVSYSDNVDAGTATVTVTGAGGYGGTVTVTFTISPASIEGADVALGAAEYVYDGEPKEPSVAVVLDGATLTEGTDYTVGYSDNTDAGTATATVTGAGNYAGTATATFEISKAGQELAFESDAVEVHVNGTPGANALSGAQGEVTYSSSDESVATVDADGAVTIVGAGEAAITATAASTDNYDEASASYALAVTAHEAGEAVAENEVEASCTEDGSYDSVAYCTVCGEELSREAVAVAAAGHTPGDAVVENEVAATCTEDGSYDSVVYCSVCGEELSRETVAVAAAGHDYAATGTVEPTCTEAGYTTYTCTVCGDSYAADEVEATGHTAADAVTEDEVAATASQAGSYDLVVYCSVCGEELSRETVEVAALGYSFSDVQDASAYYYAPVYAVAGAGYMTGEGDGSSFGVGRSLNRQAMVVVLYRIFASDEEQAAYGSTSDSEGYADNATPLTDVKDAKYYTAAVNWAYDAGVATGYSTGAFGVGDKCSFQQFCTFLARALGQDGALTDAEAAEALSSFADGSKVAAYADNSVAYLCSVVYDDEGDTVVGGTAAGKLNPASSVSRERTATVVYRCMDAGLF